MKCNELKRSVRELLPAAISVGIAAEGGACRRGAHAAARLNELEQIIREREKKENQIEQRGITIDEESQRESNWINPVRMGIYLSRVVLVSNADAIPPDGKTTGDRTQRKVDGNQANPQAAQSKSARRGMPSGPQSWAPPMEKNDHPHQPQPKFSDACES